MLSDLSPGRHDFFHAGSPHDPNSLQLSRGLLKSSIGLHSLDLISPYKGITFEVNPRAVGKFKLLYLHWSGQFQLKHRLPNALYLIYLALEGSLAVQLNNSKLLKASANEAAVIVNPGQEVVVRPSDRGQALAIAIERTLVEKTLGSLLDKHPKKYIIFYSTINRAHKLGRSLIELGKFLWEVEDEESATSSLMLSELEQAFLTCLLKGLPHNYSETLLLQRVGVLACYVQKAQVYIESNLQEDLKLSDIAAAVAVSPRILQKAFAQHCGCSPMQFFKRIRLQHAREELCNAKRGTKVTDVMLRYGFNQGGKFAKSYREMFGELPSETLKRH